MDASSLLLPPLVLLSYLKIVLDGENEPEDPAVQPRTQVTALRLVQLVGVRGSIVHTGWNTSALREGMAQEAAI